MLNDVLTLLGIICLLILAIVATTRFNMFFYYMLVVKPFIDITVNSVIVADFNALEISGALIFIVALIKYISLKGKSLIYNHNLVWFFILLQVLSFTIAFNSGEQTFMAGLKYFLRLFNSYFIYFIAAIDIMSNPDRRISVYRNVWYTTLAAGIITTAVYFSGVSNSDTTRGLVRYNGLYNDPGTPSYLSVICLLFMSLYLSVMKQKQNLINRILFYFTWGLSLFILYITLTKSAIVMLVVFSLMWFGIHKRKFFLIIPALFVAGYFSFINISGFETRFETEINFLESGDSESAKSVGTGRVNRWETLLDQYFNDFDLPTQLLGTSKNFAAHNQYIAYLMQVGFIGLFVFVLILVRFIKRLIEIGSKKNSPELFAALTLLVIYSVYGFTGHPFDYTTLLWYLMILLAGINVYENEIRALRRELFLKQRSRIPTHSSEITKPSLSI